MAPKYRLVTGLMALMSIFTTASAQNPLIVLKAYDKSVSFVFTPTTDLQVIRIPSCTVELELQGKTSTLKGPIALLVTSSTLDQTSKFSYSLKVKAGNLPCEVTVTPPRFGEFILATANGLELRPESELTAIPGRKLPPLETGKK